MINTCLKNMTSVALLFISLGAVAASPQLVAPPYNVSNRHSVNVTTGQVQMTHADVSIGGNMGLSHSISMHNSSWIGADADPSGPTDQYSGRLMCVRRSAYTGDNRFWLIASDGTTTQFFDPGTSPTAAVPDANGNFPPLVDKRYSLRYEPTENGMVMTKPDGTKIIYGGSQVYTNMQHFCSTYDMTEIRRPDGFTTKIKLYTNGKPASVITNTGFQLRYYFIPRSPSVDPVAWWGLNPAYVVGINNASQYCPHTAGDQLNSGCTTDTWPKVQYIWPNNMPYAGGTFSVIDPNGGRTDYAHTVFTNGPSTAMRLVSVKPPGATAVTQQYSYLDYVIKAPSYGIYFYWPSELGILSRSWVGNEHTDVINYSPRTVTQLGLFMSSSGYKPISSAYTNASNDSSGGKLVKISAWDYSADFNSDGFVQTYSDVLQQVTSTYAYDGRGNVTGITSRGATQSAEYEASCDANNYKYCNKPKWISDGRLNKTYFTYHQASGQIETITYPANKNSKTAQTRYGYMQLTAKYHQDTSGTRQAGTPIWMLTSEKSCSNSNFTSVCSSSDEVVTTYEYNDNLLLKGTTVTADGKTLRTCFQYDKYGNQIGKTAPKAGLTSCSN